MEYEAGKVQNKLRDEDINKILSTFDAKKKVNCFKPKKKNPVLRRVVEGLFLCNAGPKSGCLSYLIVIIGKETSDVWETTLISVRYD